MSDPRLTLMEAISRKLNVEAQYNGATIRFSPHLMFERHGDLFVSALNLGKVWRSDEEPRLGQFKLAGLSQAKLLDRQEGGEQRAADRDDVFDKAQCDVRGWLRAHVGGNARCCLRAV